MWGEFPLCAILNKYRKMLLEYVKSVAAVLKVRPGNALKCPLWDVKGNIKETTTWTMCCNLANVPLRLCPDLHLSHWTMMDNFTILCPSPWNPCDLTQLDLRYAEVKLPPRTLIAPSPPSSFLPLHFLYICVVVCSHDDRIHGNTDPMVLNNKGVWMWGAPTAILASVSM